ncbi:MAG: inositol monophosphatase family protein [Acidobacteriota bacterium]
MPSFLETAVDIAGEASALVSDYARRHVAIELKGDHDLVTAADRASEKLIVERLRREYPTHSIVAEEGGDHSGSSEYCWYVDPLDGTTNFAHGFPVYNVTLALEHAGELIAGVIADPTRSEVFSAERGAGAFLNGDRIHVSKAARLDHALVGTGFPSRKRHRNVNVHYFHQISMVTHGVRRAGAAALDLAYVACGRLDMFWEFQLNPWDIAAGVLLIREAGGVCTDMQGAPVQLRGPNILVDNALLHDETLALFAEVYAGKYRQALPELPGQ